jgi:Raf kinase inhibitor-like YbhB/YbcL family protein
MTSLPASATAPLAGFARRWLRARNLPPIVACLFVSGAGVLAAACGGDDGSAGIAIDAPFSMTVASDAFAEGASIPPEFTCDGDNVSPPLRWDGAPEGAKAFVLIVDDPDAPGGTFDHWLVYDIPPGIASLEQAASPGGALPAGARQGRNGFGKSGYGGPCPPKGGPHHYVFRIFAVDAPLGLEAGARSRQLLEAMQGHVLAQGQLVGLYQRR